MWTLSVFTTTFLSLRQTCLLSVFWASFCLSSCWLCSHHIIIIIIIIITSVAVGGSSPKDTLSCCLSLSYSSSSFTSVPLKQTERRWWAMKIRITERTAAGQNSQKTDLVSEAFIKKINKVIVIIWLNLCQLSNERWGQRARSLRETTKTSK